jgi:hypothetical protein
MPLRNYSLFMLCFWAVVAQAQQVREDKFKQLYEELPTPNSYRNAAGAPGHEYWQQRADYNINIELDDDNQRITGSEIIKYYNNSPDALTYIWVQLDQNLFAPNSDAQLIRTQRMDDKMHPEELARFHAKPFSGGYSIDSVTDVVGKKLPYVINKTMMRIDLPKPLASKQSYSFRIKWSYNINDGVTTGARTGYEFFPDDKNYTYHIAQFYPRVAVYNDVDGWQNKQFLGRGEFTLCFGNFNVSITTPSDHIVAATGELQNSAKILTAEQLKRFEGAKKADKPTFIVTQAEATEKEKTKAKDKKTWVFKATNVRDFAFASSRKFIWDAQGVPMSDGRTVMAMSYYPKEGNPLWERYSTRAIIHTMKVYGKYTFDYPYPVAISTHASFTGMEYPMISFNFGRPRPDGTYPERTKYGMIGVVIHEVGHNWFPMIVNSDERQWTWMDEGLNSFLEYLTEVEWERDFPVRRGPAPNIVDYMKGDKSGLEPIMTNSESIIQFGNNAYGKPATALNILRETIMGRELFDHAFKEYANRWKFKHPTPADFFRTMEDASGVDLDWFWRGWFYGIDHVDITLEEVTHYQPSTLDTKTEAEISKKYATNGDDEYISVQRNKKSVGQTVMEKYPELKDEYNDRDPNKLSPAKVRKDEAALKTLTEEDKAFIAQGYNYYEVKFKNKGGLVMPIILQIKYTDGTSEINYFPAEIWRFNSGEVSKVFVSKKEIAEMILDPYLETADTDRSNNYYPPRLAPTRFETFRGN